MKIVIRATYILFLLACSCEMREDSVTGWQTVYQNDSNGTTVFGSKVKLIDAVRLGYPIRIGWGANRVEHVADAEFLTINQGKEVFAQINTIKGQQPLIQDDSLKIRFRIGYNWTMMAGTNGFSTGFTTDYFNDSLVGGGMDRYISTTWYALYPEHTLQIKASPLWRKESPNWERWKETE